MKKHPQDLSQLFNASGKLPEIKEKAELLIRLDQCLKQQLSLQLAQQVRVANLRHDNLVLETPTAAWAARLNFQKPQILLQLQREALPMLSAIDVKVNPRMNTSSPDSQLSTKTKYAQLSITSASHIESLAENVEGSLGQKLKRLAALASR
ncbi:MAG: DUF721 domain-containing protein [Parashewanella sp.]